MSLDVYGHVSCLQCKEAPAFFVVVENTDMLVFASKVVRKAALLLWSLVSDTVYRPQLRRHVSNRTNHQKPIGRRFTLVTTSFMLATDQSL